ncbi:hypothetical protein LCGC14_2583080 [marine sediment metagenome]|uniref:Terminase small subunit n=1 Tax=marine sediment metagenome TaxID=412755 RepID=A0A0F9CQ04_9ZZZZ
MAAKVSIHLNPRRLRFVQEYLKEPNGAQAARLAGYAHGSAKVTAANLLTDPNVKLAIADGMGKAAEATGITVQRVLEELGVLAFSRIDDYLEFQPGGDAILDWSRVPEGAMRAVSEIVQEEYMDGKGDGARKVRRTKFKLHSKPTALEMLARHLRMFQAQPSDKDDAPPLTINALVNIVNGHAHRL